MADINEDPKKMNPNEGGSNEDSLTATHGSQTGPRQNDDKNRDPKRTSEPGQPGQTSPSRPGQDEPQRSGGREEYDPAKRQNPKSNF